MSWDDRLDDLFERALDFPQEDRAAFIEDACGDDRDLHAELRSLLDAHETQPDFLERLASDVLGRGFAAGSAQTDVPGLPPGSTVGRYEILGRLGAGSMGVVYRAHDPELDRPVALKFLAPRLSADDTARARLRSEARAASALDHPNIAVVYEIGSAMLDDGEATEQFYIAMAHYDGETLDQRISQGPARGNVALGILEQLADGLGRAHEKGIVHRDIKPTNLLMTPRGVLKILDFGVANVAAGPESVAAGTPAYMSPEQSRGDGVGARSDVWAAGVILFELLTGRRPFEGDSQEELIRAIRNHDPFQDLRIPDEPRGLADLLHRCLAKDPAGRPADGGALLGELRAIRCGALPRAAVPSDHDDARPSIVVLPFANLGRGDEDEYFSDGLTDEVISVLSRVRSLRVLSRTSSMRLKEVDSDIPTITRRVRVDHALEGSVRRAGDAVRITARLVDGPRDDTVWSDTYVGSVADVFAIQEKVAYAIVEALELHLSDSEERAITARPISDIRAYESYLRARYEGWRFSPEGLERARRHIESALGIVGDNALLYASLGHIMAMHVEVGVHGSEAVMDEVASLRDRVFALDPESPRGYWLTSWLAFQQGDMVRSVQAGEAAVAELPDDPDTLLLLGYLYGHVGRNSDATELMARALEIDPLTPFVHGVQGFVPILEGRYDDAVRAYRTHHDMDPASPFANVFYGWALAYAGEVELAADVLHRTAHRFPGTAFGSLAASLGHGLRGEAQEAVDAITPVFRAAAERSEMFARELAHCLSLAGRHDEALKWVEREVELGMWNYDYLARHDRLLDELRSDPRFDAILERVRGLDRSFEEPGPSPDGYG